MPLPARVGLRLEYWTCIQHQPGSQARWMPSFPPPQNRKDFAMDKQQLRFIYRPQPERLPRWLGRVLSWF